MASRIAELTDKLNAKRDRMRKSKETYTKQYEKDLDQIDFYYGSLASAIE